METTEKQAETMIELLQKIIRTIEDLGREMKSVNENLTRMQGK